ncbi:P-loop containing nucleoside triphosphate hydrolase protein [Pleomassaria siparia CBS 279.74]|uniref:DNA 3'-5' helicase n=1 Tax=Pleomassaria siparia CBS 279.74 TaxID=1314801 RepID=A0A6G1JXE7_9PLEO|nr:P-loop containing nucleoside triphosphate hydrolase protein [Pleomassaria siparia CBS 279.74]
MDELLNGLNAAQRSAVSSPALVLQVLAPPGSGKTKTLTARIAYLTTVENLQPWNIIACTFTLKAAREMKERIRGIVGDIVVNKLILGTFHSVARRFLVRYGQEIGIPKNFGIADTSDSKAIIKRIITRGDYRIDPSQARSRISGLKAKGTTAEQFSATSAASKKIDQHEFACVYSEYEETLKISNQLDYDDLLLRCVELLTKHPECVSSIQAVLIDEYQDTNNIQYEMMTLLARKMKRITIVGDPDQSIYSFRSAEIKNLYRMRAAYPETVVVNLEDNYRSSACIISSAKAVIEQDENRPNKSLLPTHCAGEQPTLRHLATANVEAQWIVGEIDRSTKLCAGLLNFSDYAILLRSAALSLSIERELGNAGIPYRMVGGRRFFDRAEIKIVLDYLRVINQPDHNDALVRVINVPSRKIGEPTVKKLLEEAETSQMTLWKLVLDCAQGRRKPQCKISTQAQKGIDTFVNLILTSRMKLFPAEDEDCNLYELINHVLQKISFEAYLKATHKENWRERWENVEELIGQATQMATAASKGDDTLEDALPVVDGIDQRQDTAADLLSKFLANVALSTEMEKEEGVEQQQVTISTIHAAKGLEWPVVFIPAVYNGSIPHSRAEDHDEERRLLYVGMTRAQGLLYLSCPVKQSSEGETTLSQFISSPRIQRFFSLRGPSFGCTVIGDLARILRRPCPSARDVEISRTLVERFEDDRYPLNKDEIDGEDSSWSANYASSDVRPQPYKRRRTEPANLPAGIAASVTMHSANYSISTTTLPSGNTGFTTAKDLKAIQEEAESIRMLVSASSATVGKVAYAASKKTEPKTRTKTVKPRVAGQGAITSFFTRPGGTVSEPPALPAPKMPSFQRSSSAFQQQAPKAPSFQRSSSSISQQGALNHTSNVETKAYQPPTFFARRPSNAPMASKPKRSVEDFETTKHVLLSSSPVRPQIEDNPPPAHDGELPQSPTKPTSVSLITTTTTSSSTSFPGFRPAATFHTTSMGQLQGQSTAPQRRTLGARRSMQGWSVKNNQMPQPRPS